MELYDNILKNSIKGKKNYIFLDEIQEIKDFEKCVIGLYENKDIDFDIYITGSNSRMFSQELATLFTGRETEIHIFPLSFKEIYDFSIQKTNVIDKYTIFNQYKMFGGLPILLEHYENVEMNKKDLAMVVDGCIQKDIRNRNKIRNFVNFRKVTKYVFLQIGQMLSVLNLASYIESNNKETLSHHTITRYLL
jgi:predicted AAA+ superfamily ATPase